jgi:hypothetical protein
MTHIYHDNLPGYDARNCFHDGCPTCTERAEMGIECFRWIDEVHTAKIVAAWARHEITGQFADHTSNLDQKVVVAIYKHMQEREILLSIGIINLEEELKP